MSYRYSDPDHVACVDEAEILDIFEAAADDPPCCVLDDKAINHYWQGEVHWADEASLAANEDPPESLRVEIVTYCVLRDRHGRVWAYRRGGAGGEERLHGEVSIGVGGNVEARDRRAADGFTDIFRRACYRELYEEVAIVPPPDEFVCPELEGLLYMPGSLDGEAGSPGANADHVGLVYVLDLPQVEAVESREPDAVEPIGFRRPARRDVVGRGYEPGLFAIESAAIEFEAAELEDWTAALLDDPLFCVVETDE